MGRARRLLTESGLHALPIIDGQRTLGVVTLADCHERSDDETLGDVISRPPVTIDAEASPADAASLMRAEYVHHLLVTEGPSSETIGILSSFDLLALLASA